MKKFKRAACLFLSAVLICSVLTACAKTMSYSGSALTAAKVGDPYTATVAAVKDIDSVTYAKTGGNLPGGLILSSAGEITGTPTARGSFSFTVTASAKGYKNAEAQFSIEVAERLSLTYSTSSLAEGKVGDNYSDSVATAAGADSITYSRTSGSLPAGLTLNPDGTITGVPTAKGEFAFTVTAGAAGYSDASAQFSIKITNPLSYSASALPGAKLGIEYKGEGGAAVSVATATGTPSITYAITSGSLPAGLTFTSGIIAGTPTVYGSFDFTVTASAAGYDSASAIFSISVSVLDLLYEGGTLAAGKIGTAYSATVATATADEGSPDITYEITEGDLPDGLTFDNGIISGTPTAAGTFDFTVTASDKNSYYNSDYAGFTIVISPVIKYGGGEITALTAKVNAPYTGSVADAEVIGATLDITYTLKSGILPLNLVLNSDGTITGTPAAVTASPVSFTVTAGAAGCESADAEFTISITDSEVINFSGATLTPGQLSVPYNASVATATAAGNPQIEYAVTSGSLPAGLNMSANGIISGTPTAVTPGSVSFRVTASANVAGYVPASANFSIRINYIGVLSYAGKALADGKQGEEYAGDSIGTATGAPAASITYEITEGGLPAGLSLNGNTGAVTGTPEESGQFSFTVKAAALNYSSANAVFTVKIDPPTSAVTEYVFEAEYVLLEWVQDENVYVRPGIGFSGPGSGYMMLWKDIPRVFSGSTTEKTAKASNGYFITGMYINNSFIDFEIYSDSDVEDAQLTARLTAEYVNPVRIAPTNRVVGGEEYWSYLFEVINLGAKAYDPLDPALDFIANQNYKNIAASLDYAPIALSSITEMQGDPLEDFKDYLISTSMKLVKGTNIIRLRTNNNNATAGSMSAVAPVVDCLKIQTGAGLSMKKYEGNLEYANT